MEVRGTTSLQPRASPPRTGRPRPATAEAPYVASAISNAPTLCHAEGCEQQRGGQVAKVGKRLARIIDPIPAGKPKVCSGARGGAGRPEVGAGRPKLGGVRYAWLGPLCPIHARQAEVVPFLSQYSRARSRCRSGAEGRWHPATPPRQTTGWLRSVRGGTLTPQVVRVVL